MGGVISSKRWGVGVAGSLLVLFVWGAVSGVIPGPETPTSKAPGVGASSVPAVERSNVKASLSDCTWSIINTGDFGPGCAGWAEDDSLLTPAFQVLEILQADQA